MEEEFGIILSLNVICRPLFKTKSLNRFHKKKAALSSVKTVRGTADMLGTTGKPGLNLWTKGFRKAAYVSVDPVAQSV